MTIQFKSDFFFLGGGAGCVVTNSLILSRVNLKMGPKRGIPEKNHLQAELGLSHMWPELGLNPQWWDNERFSDLDRYRLASLTIQPGGGGKP